LILSFIYLIAFYFPFFLSFLHLVHFLNFHPPYTYTAFLFFSVVLTGGNPFVTLNLPQRRSDASSNTCAASCELIGQDSIPRRRSLWRRVLGPHSHGLDRENTCVRLALTMIKSVSLESGLHISQLLLFRCFPSLKQIRRY
jgi:hypothetical protein